MSSNIIIEYLYRARDYFGGFISEHLVLLQFIAVVLSALFIAGLIYILNRVGYGNIKSEQFMHLFGGSVSKRRSIKGWKQIQKRLSFNDPAQWKIAILEADRILDEILKMAGYLGRMDDKIELLTSAQISNIEEIKSAHLICHQIAQDANFELSQEAALQTVEIYRKAFMELNLIQE